MKVSSVARVFTLLPICHTHLSLQCSFSPTVAFFLSNQRWIKSPSPSMRDPEHWPEFPSFLLCFLCLTVPVSLLPHPFISSLSLCMSPLQLPLLLNMNPMQTVFCYPFHATLSVIHISQAVYLFIRMPLYENTCMQDGCFQGYHRGTKQLWQLWLGTLVKQNNIAIDTEC